MTTVERISKLISEKYPSDYAFENEFGLPQKKVYDWKNGRSQTYLKMLPKIAEHFGVSTAYLLCETDDPKVDDLDIDPRDIRYAMLSETQELSDDEMQEIVEFIRFKKQQRKKI